MGGQRTAVSAVSLARSLGQHVTILAETWPFVENLDLHSAPTGSMAPGSQASHELVEQHC
jgi:hypothetical protein